MRRRLLPSLSALRAFEAVARHESFTQAASELNVTQSAASRQVRALEGFLELPLFNRTSRRIELTAEGRFYANLIKEALDRVEAGTAELIATRKGSGTLSIGVLPTFGTRWLIPRLEGFQREHPEIQLNIVSSDGELNFAEQKIDVAIRFGTGSWPEATAEPLMSEEIVVACSPALATEFQGQTGTLEWLAKQRLLQHSTRPDSWAHWFRSVGFDGESVNWGPKFEHFFMLTRAAQEGIGVALAPRFLIEEELARGVLVVPLPFRVAGPGAYYLVTPKAKQDMARVKLFRSWVLAEAAKLPAPSRQRGRVAKG